MIKKNIALLVLCVVINGCCFVNAAGRKALAFYPADKLDSQADISYEEQKKSNPPAQNKQHEMIVKRVADRLIAVAKRDYAQYCKGFDWEVVLFEKPKTLNAWCMPGGRMAVYTGILKACENEGALAAVMGHEISHALLEHGNERMSQSLLTMGLTTGAIMLLENSEITEEEKQSYQLALGVVSAGGQLMILKYSRSHESEADKMGLSLMASAGYDPSEAPKLWHRMAKLSGGNQPPEFLSTHPSHDTRIHDLEALQIDAKLLYEKAPVKYGVGVSFIK